ncbi:ABC transporter substrate-binding protein [Hungatella sp. SB206]|uniref:ABC transporter substrate-binding protein n=1 Tax=Hungatella sp. SB206 TaxID=2937758 RepID=UPI003DAA4C18
MKRKVSCMLSAAMLVMALNGCGAQKQETSEAVTVTAADREAEKSTGTEAAGTTDSGEKVKLRFLNISPSDTRDNYFKEIFATFEKETGIEVEYESTPLETAANKITVMGGSNTLPDIITMPDNWIPDYRSAGWIIPVTDFIEPDKELYTDVVNKIIWGNQQKLYGDVYTIPDGLMVKGIYVRKDWCDEAGITLDYDWTYDDYFEVNKKLTDASKNRYGLTYRGARGAFDVIMSYLHTYTGGYTYNGEGNCLLNKDEAVDAFIRFTDMYKDGYAPKESINWGFTEMVNSFCGDLTGTFNNDPEVVAICQSNMKEGTWAVMPMPRSNKDGKIYNQVSCGYSYAITSSSKTPDQAYELIQFMNQPENHTNYCKTAGQLPVIKACESDPYFGEDGPYAAFIYQLNSPNLVVPATFGPFETTDLQQGPMIEEIQKYLMGQQDAQTALDSFCNVMEERMKAYLKDNPGSTVEEPRTMQ